MTKLKDNELLLGKDDVSIVLKPDGTLAPKSEITWSGSPSEIVFAPPYLVGLLSQSVEVRSIRSKKAVQSIQLPNAKLISVGPTILVASPTSIWRLLPLDFEDQIEQLLASCQFTEAQTLIEDLEFPSEDDKAANIVRVRGMQAHYMFTYEHKYAEAIAILQELKGSPLDVINLFPEFNPDLADPSCPFIPSEKAALLILMDYLTTQRAVLTRLRKEFEEAGFPMPPEFPRKTKRVSLSDRETRSGVSGTDTVWSGLAELQANGEAYGEEYDTFVEIVYLSRVVDNTLLKVYLTVNDALVGVFLRVVNMCDLEECEELLLQHQKYVEVIDLFRGKGLHRKALQFMVEYVNINERSFKNVVLQMVSYLQRLHIEELDMILEFADWAIRKNPQIGIKIFTEQFDEIPFATRKRITEFLEIISSDLATEYLVHIIHELHDQEPEFHDRLILNYVAKIVALADSVDSLATAIPPKLPGVEDTEIIILRRMLLAFMDESMAYKISSVFPLFPEEGLYEERCVLLNRLGRHEEALHILVFKLHRPDLAETYCQRHYNLETEASNVFVILLRFFTTLVKTKQMPNEYVIEFMGRNGPNMDVAESLQMVPGEVKLIDLQDFFEKALHNLHRSRNVDEIVKNLLLAERLQVQEKLIFDQAKKVTITEDRMCSKCLKRIANSVFSWYPDGSVVHVYCAKSYHLCNHNNLNKFKMIEKVPESRLSPEGQGRANALQMACGVRNACVGSPAHNKNWPLLCSNIFLQMFKKLSFAIILFAACASAASVPTAGLGEFCGGIIPIRCSANLECKLDGSYPDAGGICVQKNAGLGEFCGGIVPILCASNLECKINGSNPDAGGVCVLKAAGLGEPCGGFVPIPCKAGLVCKTSNIPDAR
ncbi:Vam6/Vps39-like protein, partial [Nowakowskiella sp. JEL0078]